MDGNERYSYWEDIAEYDFETANAMLNSGRYLYVVFMCQQAIEKIVKGLFVYYNEEEPPRTHNIINVLEKIHFKDLQSVSDKLEEYRDFLEELLAFYISERYPSYKERLSATIDQKHAQQVLFKAKEVFSWLKSLK